MHSNAYEYLLNFKWLYTPVHNRLEPIMPKNLHIIPSQTSKIFAYYSYFIL